MNESVKNMKCYTNIKNQTSSLYKSKETNIIQAHWKSTKVLVIRRTRSHQTYLWGEANLKPNGTSWNRHITRSECCSGVTPDFSKSPSFQSGEIQIISSSMFCIHGEKTDKSKWKISQSYQHQNLLCCFIDGLSPRPAIIKFLHQEKFSSKFNDLVLQS